MTLPDQTRRIDAMERDNLRLKAENQRLRRTVLRIIGPSREINEALVELREADLREAE